MAQLSRRNYDRIVNILLPIFADQDSRRVIIHQAFFEDPHLITAIDYSGSPRSFTAKLIQTLDNYGKTTQGQIALIVLLETVRENIGPDKQRGISEIIASLAEESSDKSEIPFEQVSRLLLPIFGDPISRQVVIQEAFLDEPQLLERIDFSGSSRRFTSDLVRELYKYGETTQGKPALVVLLEIVRSQVGRERQREIDEIIALLDGESSDEPNTTAWFATPAFLGGIFAIFAAILSGIFGLWQGMFIGPPETLTPTAVAVIVDTPTSTSTTTPDIAAAVATLSFEQTSTALAHSVTSVPYAEATAAARATEYAERTQAVIDATATANLWTATPTPDMTASIDTYRTQQAATVTQAWIDSLTDTPTSTPNLRDTAEARLTMTALAENPTRIASAVSPTVVEEDATATQYAVETAVAERLATAVTWTPTSTPSTTATESVSIAFQATLEYLEALITPTIQPDASAIGNGQLYPFYDDRVNYPDVMDVELHLILYELIITPTPSGQATVVAANDDIERPRVEQNPSPLETPRPARVEDDLEGVPPFIIAELECSDSVFSGCEAQDVRDVQLRGVNEWLWRVQPIVEQPSRQSLSLVLYAANPDGSKVSNTPIYRHNFVVEVGNPFTLRGFMEENTAALISGITAILAAVVAGVFALMQSKKKSNAATASAKTDTSETNMDDVSGGSVSIGSTNNYHGNVTINQGTNMPSDSNDGDEKDTVDRKNKPTAFISYRRSGGWEMAHIIRDCLRIAGGDIFLDVHDIHEGRFADIIQKNIDEREFFIVILAPGTLESKWVKREIRHAIDNKKKVIPVLINDFDLYGDEMPDDLSDIADYNAIRIEQMYLDAGIDRIAVFMGLKKGS